MWCAGRMCQRQIKHHRRSFFSLCVAVYNEKGEEQDEAGLELEGKQVDVGEMKFHLPPAEIHLPDHNYQEAVEDRAVVGDMADILDPDFNVGIMEVPLPSEEVQEALGNTREDTASVDSLYSYLAMLETCLFPELQEEDAVDVISLAALSLSLPRPEIPQESQSLQLARCPAPFKPCPGCTIGYKEDSQDINSVLGSMAREVNFASKVKLEGLGDMEGDTVDVSNEDSTLATPQIHSDPEELKEAEVNGVHGQKEPLEVSNPASHVEPTLASTRSERIAPSPGCASKTSMTPKPLPKKVVKPLPKETKRDPSQILLPGTECKAAKSLTRKQQKAHRTNYSCNFDSLHAKIIFFKLILKLVELAALPQRILFQIISYYQQQLSDWAGQEV